MKEQYIEYAKNTFTGKAKELVINQINLFFSQNPESKNNNYNIGDYITLKKGTFIHGIPGYIENFDWIVKNGFISSNFSGNTRPNKLFHNVGMWNIKEDILLRDYIKLYSGVTLGYNIGRGPTSKKETKLIPYQCFEEEISLINNSKDIWSWWAEQTKEIRFIPSLASDKIQIAFILNMESNYAQELKKADLFSDSMSKDILEHFVVEQYIDRFITEERDSFTTDRESAIIFGLPSSLIEGVLVGKRLEEDEEALNHIKEKLPNCYICDLEGYVIKK